MTKLGRALAMVFVMAVLLPCAALSLLALRAADRESSYAERRLEGSLMAEVGLAAREIEQYIARASASLEREIGAGMASSPDEWRAADALVETVFVLRDGRLETSGASASGERVFRDAFGGFLTGGERLPVYDSVTRVYRMDPAEGSGETEYKSAKSRTGAGISRQIAESRIASDNEAREELFRQAADEGFETMRRNVIPSVGGEPAAVPPAADGAARVRMPGVADVRDDSLIRSKTISKSRSFGELSSESDAGFLPYMSQGGLEVLFWARAPDGTAAGCSVRMDALRDGIASVMPNIVSDVRVLTVLDEDGRPIVKPDAGVSIDWGRPFAAREISPVLPRWEAGAWLRDPLMVASRAGYVRAAIWILVAVLFSVIAAGSAVVLRAVSYETRVASQKTTFVANVSHELKTPLTSIKLYSELLLSGKQTDPERRREYLRTMMSETDRLACLVDNVLSFSRRGGKLAAETVSLSGIARETADQMSPYLSKLGFALSPPESGDIFVRGNRSALKQIIMNLLSNAEKYSARTKEIEVKCFASGGFARCDVADRGIGVPRGMEEKIFHEFARGDDSLSAPRSGTGLGLTIARNIAREHGGDVSYAPREGGGSVFSLVLPEVKPE
jgi:signal transduction histidine kinase